VERAQVHVVEYGDDGEIGAAVARAVDDDLDFVLAIPRGALVVDRDAALWAYAQYGATVVLSTDGFVRAGPAWALVALDQDTAETDLDVDDAGLLAATVDDDTFVEVRGVRVVVDEAVPAVVVATAPLLARMRAELDQAMAEHRVVLAYDARPVADGPIMVAPEILQLPCFDESTCAALVELATATDLWGSDPDDPVPGDEVSLALLSPQLFARVEDHLDTVVVPALRAHWPEIAWNGLHDAFVIRYRAATRAPSSELRLHHDVAQISASVRLDDDYDGGALEFPRQQWTNVEVPVGDLIAWPSLVTHPHRGAPVTRGVKHALTLWLRLPE
jgi:hypothetical protein